MSSLFSSQFFVLQAVFVVNNVCTVFWIPFGYSNDGTTELFNVFNGPGTYVTETLNDNFSFGQVDAELFASFTYADGDTITGSVIAAEGTMEWNWLTGENAEGLFAGQFAIFVNHPAHALAVGTNVWSWNVDLFTEVLVETVYITTANLF